MRVQLSRGPALRLAVAGLTAALVVFALAECTSAAAPSARRTVYGTQTAMGNGTATGYVTLDSKGQVLAVGAQLTSAALTGLPPTAMSTEFPLDLPSDVAPTGVSHIILNWNPHGHPPMNIYTVPHFDVHLYIISEAQRLLIGPADSQWAAKVANKPTGDLVPANYVADSYGIPQMGVHWADTTASQYHGTPFTSTFIYGSYDGAFIFYEPMVALAFLQTKPSVHGSIGVAARYVQSLHPTSYSIGYDTASDTYTVQVDGWQH